MGLCRLKSFNLRRIEIFIGNADTEIMSSTTISFLLFQSMARKFNRWHRFTFTTFFVVSLINCFLLHFAAAGIQTSRDSEHH